jgi:hypothetical protein
MKSCSASIRHNFILIILLTVISVLAGTILGQDKQMSTPEFARQQIGKLERTAKTLLELAEQPLPAGLSTSELKEAKRYSVWLKNSSRKFSNLANQWQADLNKILQSRLTDLATATKNMQEMNMSFNLQYLMLQNKISHENRQFTLVSNIMKNKHDTAKNSINNVR